MNDKRLKLILEQLGQQGFPDETDGWEMIQRRLTRPQGMAKSVHKPGGKVLRQTNSLRLVVGIGLALIIIFSIFVVIPNKQALADAWKHLFQPAAAGQIPTPSNKELATPTFPPTFAVTLAPANIVKVSPTLRATQLSTPQSSLDACGINSYMWDSTCWIAFAEKKAGFTAKQLPSNLQGFVFSEIAQAIPGSIMMRYVAIDGNGDLIFTQWNGNGFPTFRGAAPESAIEEVQVGDYQGEFVAGAWATQSSDPKVYWNSCCRYTLRWMEGERSFELELNADPSPYSSRAAIIQLATQLVDHPMPAAGPRADYLTSLAEASQLAEFAISSPGLLPEDFIFRYGSYNKDLSQLRLRYAPPGVEGLASAGISIVETPLDKVSLTPEENGENLKGDNVDINRNAAIFSSNNNQLTNIVTWEAGELRITLTVWSSSGYGGTFTKDQILEIARSMK